MQRSRNYTWAVLEVESVSGRPADVASVRDAVDRIEGQALVRAGINPALVDRHRLEHGSVLGLIGVPRELAGRQFVDALREAILEYDATCPAGQSIRIRLSLHTADVGDNGTRGNRHVDIAIKLAGSALIKRVLAASTGSPLALIVSADWYDAAVRDEGVAGEGYQDVWIEQDGFAGPAWVRVPGRTRPPGLLPDDDPTWHSERGRGDRAGKAREGRHSQSTRGADYSINVGNVVRDSTIEGDVVFGSKYGQARPDTDEGRR